MDDWAGWVGSAWGIVIAIGTVLAAFWGIVHTAQAIFGWMRSKATRVMAKLNDDVRACRANPNYAIGWYAGRIIKFLVNALMAILFLTFSGLMLLFGMFREAGIWSAGALFFVTAYFAFCAAWAREETNFLAEETLKKIKNGTKDPNEDK